MLIIHYSNIIKPVKSGAVHFLGSWVPVKSTGSFIGRAEQNMATCSSAVQTTTKRNPCVVFARC